MLNEAVAQKLKQLNLGRNYQWSGGRHRVLHNIFLNLKCKIKRSIIIITVADAATTTTYIAFVR